MLKICVSCTKCRIHIIRISRDSKLVFFREGRIEFDRIDRKKKANRSFVFPPNHAVCGAFPHIRRIKKKKKTPFCPSLPCQLKKLSKLLFKGGRSPKQARSQSDGLALAITAQAATAAVAAAPKSFFHSVKAWWWQKKNRSWKNNVTNGRTVADPKNVQSTYVRCTTTVQVYANVLSVRLSLCLSVTGCRPDCSAPKGMTEKVMYTKKPCSKSSFETMSVV